MPYRVSEFGNLEETAGLERKNPNLFFQDEVGFNNRKSETRVLMPIKRCSAMLVEEV